MIGEIYLKVYKRLFHIPAWRGSPHSQPIMANYHIRKYEDKDYDAVRDIFAIGMSEHIPACFTHCLKQPVMQLSLMCVFCALLLSSKSFLLPVMAVTFLLAAARQVVNINFRAYIERSLNEDLLDINKSYMQSKDSSFWIAECDGNVVATVSTFPSKEEPGTLELKRMSVIKNYRGRGIAKTLCRTVLQFARENGYPTVILKTSVVQYEAQKLYECFGFKKSREFLVPERIAKLCNFTVIVYRYDILAHD
ncbi:probable N-acetyltransferase camello isoform X1 [Erpetoichthys calabaricus]|uniref:probable N-acetyltransferase camello isoform X1 n=2 Tax=Erpetoichthys calabaricus TaxID=27687 RepID=UPI00223444C6|nr:probable N-acetyltransferase camello isoform X1 [Erpetoichthys calabaricus]